MFNKFNALHAFADGIQARIDQARGSAPILYAETSDGGSTYKCNGEVMTAAAWKARADAWQQEHPPALNQRFNVLVIRLNHPVDADGE